MSLELKAYQREAVDFLKTGRSGLLAMSPGLGKTAIALTACRELGARRILVVAPVTVCPVWVDEVGKWYEGLPVRVLRGTPAARNKAYGQAIEAGGMSIVGYETARRDFKRLNAIAWDAVILDETVKIQNPVSKVSKAIMTLKAPIRIALNGTPISNGYGDIWATCSWLRPGCLYGNWYAFRSVHAIMNPYFPAIVGWRDVEGIKRRTAPVIFWKDKRDVLAELPPIIEQTIPVELSRAELALYDQIKKELRVTILGEDKTIQNALVELTRLRQVTNGLFNFVEGGGSSKLDAVMELVQTLPPEKKIIIFTQFATTAREIVRRIPSALCIEGATDTAARERIVESFKSSPDARVLVGTSAMSYGLNLQCASYIIHVDLPWSYAKYDQQIGRAWRMGQTDTVVVYNMEATRTVDERVRKILERKTMIAEDFAGVTRHDIVDILS